MTRVLGIDPGTHRLGWGIIDGTPSKPSLVSYGVIEMPKNTEVSKYLVNIHQKLLEILEKYQPEKVGIESLFFQKNVKTAFSVAEARGVIIFTLASFGLAASELSPNTVKSTVAGSGSAGKLEVQRMVGLLLKLDTKKLLDDTTDALAVALTAQAQKL